jgi:multiple sugar transport system substrate-binding protein
MRRGILLTILLISLLILSSLTPAQQKTLTVISGWAGAEMEGFLPVLKAFEQETGIKVEYKIYRAEDLATLLPAQFSAKTTPGDVIFMWAWFIKEKAKEGHVLELTNLINEKDFIKGSLDAVKIGNKLYGGVYTGKVKPGFWYRKSFFQKYNLTVPKSWVSFVSLLGKIKKIPGIKAPIASGDGVGWPLSDVTEHFLATFGGPQLNLDLIAGKVRWTDVKVRSIFENRLVPLLKAGYFGEPTEWTMALQMWWNGDYGLYFMGSWITGMVKDPSDLGVFSLPGARGIVFGADYLFVPAYTKYPEEAKKLAQFLVTKGQEIQVKQGGHIATNIHVPLSSYPPVDREVANLMKGKIALPDLDDTIGGEFQATFWDQLKLLWVRPERVNDVLKTLDEKAPKK